MPSDESTIGPESKTRRDLLKTAGVVAGAAVAAKLVGAEAASATDGQALLVGTNNTGTTNQTVKEFTLTQKHMFTPALGMRVEYRHDWSTEAYFTRTDGSAVRNQNTVSADWFVTF